MKAMRKIIRIDEDKCDGCGLCVPSCAEGALRIVDGKARLVAESLCDGLGACLGECPTGALTVEERPAAEFSEEAVAQHIGKQPARHAHAAGHGPVPGHAAGHGSHGRHGGGCPSARVLDIKPTRRDEAGPAAAVPSELGHWPIKLELVPPRAPFLRDADLLLAADCAPVAFGDFQRRFLAGHAIVIACPKLGDGDLFLDRLTGILRDGGVRSLTVVHMEVPCCHGLTELARAAAHAAGWKGRLERVVLGVRGDEVARAAIA